MILTPNLRKITPLSNNLELTIYSTEINDLVTRLIINSQLTDNWQMAWNLTDYWQMAKILTDNWHLYPPIQTLSQVWIKSKAMCGKGFRRGFINLWRTTRV